MSSRVGNYGGGSANATSVVSTAFTTHANSRIHVAVAQAIGGANVTTVTDSQGNAYNGWAGSPPGGTSGFVFSCNPDPVRGHGTASLWWYVADAITAGSTAVTVSSTSSTLTEILAIEVLNAPSPSFDYLANVGATDSSLVNPPYTTGEVLTSTTQPANGNDLVFSVMVSYLDGPSAPTLSYNGVPGETFLSSVLGPPLVDGAYNIQTGLGVYYSYASGTGVQTFKGSATWAGASNYSVHGLAGLGVLPGPGGPLWFAVG